MKFKQRKSLESCKRVVIKCGSLAVSDDNTGLNPKKIEKIIQDVKAFKERGVEVVLVCSGAINCGRFKFSNPYESDMASKQAYSSVGQSLLISEFQKRLSKHDITSGQVLFTHDDFKSRKRFLNLKNTFSRMIQANILAIVNENDSVSYDEITLGDNDQLSVMVAELIGADTVFFLSEASGFLGPDLKPFSYLGPDFNFEDIPRLKKTLSGKGGIESKILAVKKLQKSGVDSFLSSHTDSLMNLFVDDKFGSFVKASSTNQIKNKKKWILSISQSKNKVFLDIGALKALKLGKSLLPIGCYEVQGSFERGDVVNLYCDDEEVGAGLSEYSSEEVKVLLRKKSSEIINILGYHVCDEIIHTENLIILNSD